ncbi:MAG: hypothetical protein SFY68_12755, partial [Candidatus Sumerlaeia bacterium]|nr:hypothetical protein [Candidatus Sumerlaeia bacterium]
MMTGLQPTALLTRALLLVTLLLALQTTTNAQDKPFFPVMPEVRLEVGDEMTSGMVLILNYSVENCLPADATFQYKIHDFSPWIPMCLSEDDTFSSPCIQQPIQLESCGSLQFYWNAISDIQVNGFDLDYSNLKMRVIANNYSMGFEEKSNIIPLRECIEFTSYIQSKQNNLDKALGCSHCEYFRTSGSG